MYLQQFGLAQPPFRITPNTGAFFEGANRGATLEALLYAIVHDEGIVQVTGEVGSGKTMLLRMVIERLPGHVDTACLADPNLSRDELLHALADELHAGPPSGRPGSALRALQERLLELHAAGRKAVALIDEAHAMPAATLEQVRLLSNLETRDAKLLQIVLFGQPELEGTLERPGMRQLKDRITQRFALEPLRGPDVPAYIDFRLRAAGYRGTPLFTPAAVRRIGVASAGLTRRINVLADKSMLAAFAAGRQRIGTAEVARAIRDAAGPRHAASGRYGLPAALAAIALAAAIGYVAIRPGPEATQAIATAVAPAQSAARPIGPSPARPLVQPVLQPEAPAAPPPAGPPAATVTDGGPGPAIEHEPAASTMPAASAPVRPPQRTGTRIEAALERTASRLAEKPGDRWFIQLLSAREQRAPEVERFLDGAARLVDENELGAYRARIDGERHLAVLYGDFPDLASASGALPRLPAELRVYGAFPRRLRAGE